MAEQSFTWHLNAREERGNLILDWGTNAPFRAQQGQVMVYAGDSFPPNPEDDVKTWTWDDPDKRPWDTGLPWGRDWYCAYTAEDANGKRVYFIQLITE